MSISRGKSAEDGKTVFNQPSEVEVSGKALATGLTKQHRIKIPVASAG
jgi:hypothetical protein